jgi:ABC-type dipeptide/oligopeptide/nickel transport system permease component
VFSLLVGRLCRIVFSVIVVITIVFFLFQVVPGDQAALLAGSAATEAEIESIRRDLGLDRPIVARYVSYLTNLARGDFGYSTTFQGNPSRHILERLPASFALLAATLGMTIAIGLPAGLVAAVYHRRFIDYAVSIAVAGMLAVPNFWLGLVLMSFLAVEMRWLPSFGFTGWTSLVIPATALSARLVALVARMTRGVVLDEYHKDYVTTARAKGVSEVRIVTLHVLRNAIIPTITVIGLQTGYLLGGSVVIERLFAWPGLGELMINAIGTRDYNLVQGITLLYVFGFLVINFVVDGLYVIANPRLRRV